VMIVRTVGESLQDWVVVDMAIGESP
jgi:hypothetical protein